MDSIDKNENSLIDASRRNFLTRVIPVAMLGALGAAYGTFLSFAGRFLYPAKGRERAWLFVSEVKKMKTGDSLTYVSPVGEKIAVARQAEKGVADDFIALSSTCPHLGCQVNWESQNDRFFCPCHNGVFNSAGVAISGPPADAHQSLPKYPLKIENDLLFIDVPLKGLPIGTV